jgi:HEAT repeat protein
MNKLFHTVVLSALRSRFVFIRRQAMRVLASECASDRQAFEGLLIGLHDSDWDVRTVATRALKVQPESQELVDALVRLLSDSDWRPRRAAAEVLAELDDGRVIESLLWVLHDSSDEAMRRIAAVGLGHFDDRRAFEPLLAALGDEDMWVRIAAVEALAHVGGVDAIESLIAFFERTSFDMAAWIAVLHALGSIGDARAVPFLERVLHSTEGVTDPDGNAASIGQAASDALAMIDRVSLKCHAEGLASDEEGTDVKPSPKRSTA